MAKKFKITREWLQKKGITYVSEDGTTVMKGNKKLVIHEAICRHKYGKDRAYKTIGLYDYDYMSDKNRSGTRNLLLHRVVYAWFKGEAPEEGDICHKDDNPFNNHIDNLMLDSHKANIRQRGLGRNQHTYEMSEEDLKAQRHQRKLYDTVLKESRDRFKEVRRELIKAKADYKRLKLEVKQLKEDHEELQQRVKDHKKLIQKTKQNSIDTKEHIEQLKEDIVKWKAEWRYWVKRRSEFYGDTKGENNLCQK